MKKILYLHGFGSSGASGTVELLRHELWEKTDAAHRAIVVAPDIPLDPLEAMPMLEELAFDEMPDLIIGTSMGGFYAQQLHGFTRICVNPSFFLSKKYDIIYVGKHKWLNRRKNGETEFHVTKDTIAHFQEAEAHQFDGVTDDDRTLCHGLFGDEDNFLHMFNLHDSLVGFGVKYTYNTSLGPLTILASGTNRNPLGGIYMSFGKNF